MSDDPWQIRAIKKCRGNQTLMGCLLIAVLQKSGLHNPPRFGAKAFIGRDGLVRAAVQMRPDDAPHIDVLMPVETLRDSFREMADALKFTDAERLELFDLLKKWIVKDLRPQAQPAYKLN